KEAKTTDALTLRSLATLLRQLADGKTLETNYPAARLLREAEGVAEALGKGKRYYGGDKAGQFWLTLPAARGPTAVRGQVPGAGGGGVRGEAKKGKAVPLVIALHGAGGSENLFFDGYGNGAIARMCARRGWLLVATRGGLADGGLDEVCRLYPVDKKRIFLVG